MATTTIGVIRAALITRLEALTPTTTIREERGANVFRRRGGARNRQPGIWALEGIEQPHASDDRTFILRFGGGMTDIGPTSQAEKHTQLEAELSVLYYWPADDQADDLDLRIQQDALDIDKDITDWAEANPIAGMLPTTAVFTDQAPMIHASGAAFIKRISIQLAFWRAA